MVFIHLLLSNLQDWVILKSGRKRSEIMYDSHYPDQINDDPKHNNKMTKETYDKLLKESGATISADNAKVNETNLEEAKIDKVVLLVTVIGFILGIIIIKWI